MILTIHVDLTTGQVTVDQLSMEGRDVSAAPTAQAAPTPEPDEPTPALQLEPSTAPQNAPLVPLVAVAPPITVQPRQDAGAGLQEHIANAFARLLLEKQNQVAAAKARKIVRL